MNLGLLWFDNDPKLTLDQKIERAASYYKNKYGRTSNLCWVHPTMLTNEQSQQSGEDKLIMAAVKVRTSRSVLPNHIWLGVE